MDNYSKSYHLPKGSQEEKHPAESEHPDTGKSTESTQPSSPAPKSGSNAKYRIGWIAGFLLVGIGWQLITRPHDRSHTSEPADAVITDEAEETEMEPSEEKSEEEAMDTEPYKKVKKKETPVPTHESSSAPSHTKNIAPPKSQPKESHKETREETTLEALERANHAQVVEQAKRAGVSTEGSTLEIMERINKKTLEKYR